MSFSPCKKLLGEEPSAAPLPNHISSRLCLSNPHPQPHPRSQWLVGWAFSAQQPCLKGKKKNIKPNYQINILQPVLSLSSTWRRLGLSESPMGALECPKSTQRSSGAPKGTLRGLGHTKRHISACQDTRKPNRWPLDAQTAKPRGLEDMERHTEAAGAAE